LRSKRVQTEIGITTEIIHNLSYFYTGNQLQRVDDAAGTYTAQYGFKDNGVQQPTEFTYDADGNMTHDQNRNIDLAYNPLDLIKKVDFKNGSDIRNTYTAGGAKLKTEVYQNGLAKSTTDYDGRFVYENSKLAYIQSSEGRIVMTYSDAAGTGKTLSAFTYFFEYQLKDQLGNVCAVFNASGETQETSYYPYGMPMDGLSYTAAMAIGTSYSANKFGYNGHENQTELSLGWVDYGFRQMDPVLGVWHSADKLAESTPWISPYSYCAGDPVNHVDLLGLQSMPEQHPFYWALGWGSEEIQAWQQSVEGTSGWGGEGVGSVMFHKVVYDNFY
jgi:RHS repeat-associated protein